MRVEHQCLLEQLCKTRGSQDHSLLDLSALSAILLLLDPKPEKKLNLLSDNLFGKNWLQFYPSRSCSSASCSIPSVFFNFFLPFLKVLQLPQHFCFPFCNSYVTGSLQLYYEGHGKLLCSRVYLLQIWWFTKMKEVMFIVLHIGAPRFFFPVSHNDNWSPLRQLTGPSKPCVRPGDRQRACEVWVLEIYGLWLLLSRNWSSFIAAIYWN